MTIDEIAADAAAEIECLVFDGERNVNDWERIIKAAIKKAFKGQNETRWLSEKETR